MFKGKIVGHWLDAVWFSHRINLSRAGGLCKVILRCKHICWFLPFLNELVSACFSVLDIILNQAYSNVRIREYYENSNQY